MSQGKAILLDEGLDIATNIKLQVMKITAMLLAQPTDMAIISSFIFNQILLLASRIQLIFFSNENRLCQVTTAIYDRKGNI